MLTNCLNFNLTNVFDFPWFLYVSLTQPYKLCTPFVSSYLFILLLIGNIFISVNFSSCYCNKWEYLWMDEAWVATWSGFDVFL